jgi:hypothetical protein
MKIEWLKKIAGLDRLMADKRKGFTALFLLGGWVLILYSFDRLVDAFFIIAFFLFLIFFRPRHFILVAAFVLVIVLFDTPTLDTWTKLKELNLSTYQHVPPVLAQLFEPNSGQHVLTGQVRKMLALIQTHQLTSYRLSTSFNQDEWIRQRMIESAWPIKMESSSPFLFSPIEILNNNPNCDVIDQKEDVALEYCR